MEYKHKIENREDHDDISVFSRAYEFDSETNAIRALERGEDVIAKLPDAERDTTEISLLESDGKLTLVQVSTGWDLRNSPTVSKLFEIVEDCERASRG